MTRVIVRKAVLGKRDEGLLSPRPVSSAANLGVVTSRRRDAYEAAVLKQAIRVAQDRYLRECGHDAESLRRQAADLRLQKDLCSHGDDPRNYTSHEDAAADLETPGVVCGQCGKEKLRVGLVSPKPLAEMLPDATIRAALMIDILK